MTNRKSHYALLIDTKIDDFGRPWPAITSNSLGISQSWEPTTAKRMKIAPYCHRQYCSPLNVLFSGVRIQIASISQGVPPLGGVKQGWGGENMLFSSCVYVSKMEEDRGLHPKLLLMTNRKLCICVFHWHRDQWPWMTCNCYKFEFSENFAGFRRFGRQQLLSGWGSTA